MSERSYAAILAQELQLEVRQVEGALGLFAEKCTVPFVARYRKEVTGGLDEVALRAIAERHEYLVGLDQRRQTVLQTIEEQGKLTAELRAQIEACATKAELEDLYLPFKPKRRTRATKAMAQGLEPLALRILEQPDHGDPAAEAAAFISDELGVSDAAAALAGARDIVAERLSELPALRAQLRRTVGERGDVQVSVVPDKRGERSRFEDYYEHAEPVRSIPSHRYLAICRGESEGVLRAQLAVSLVELVQQARALVGPRSSSPFAPLLEQALQDSVERLLLPSLSNEIRGELKERAEQSAIEVFAQNVRTLLLAPPLGPRRVAAVDPGLRTGCKIAILDATGRCEGTELVQLSRDEEQEGRRLGVILSKAKAEAVAVGNGTGGREALSLVRRAVHDAQLGEVIAVPVSESGASVYSASDLAREELPDLDVTYRGAVSIGRRLQDPLAELVKIDPKAIGVGQYQHDVHQPTLKRKLEDVVESCVNHVGVNLNTASAELLRYVSGIGPTLAQRIVAHRDAGGAFPSRAALRKVKGFGPKAFEQAAGFLRVAGDHPLDSTAVHPERYEVVERMADDLGVEMKQLVGGAELARRLDLPRYVAGDVGLPTLQDILEQLCRPGRDPRDRFDAPAFREDVTTLADLKEGMVLEGVVTNVTDFGAFVDVGVHQDGLVHVSQLADRFVRTPSEVVEVGQKLQVRVLSVDLERRRISLSARSNAGPKTRSGDTKTAAPGAETDGDRRGRDREKPAAREKPASKGPLTYNPFAKLR
jgi:protein Tex